MINECLYGMQLKTIALREYVNAESPAQPHTAEYIFIINLYDSSSETF